MSDWKTIKKKEFELDGDEINFYVCSDDNWGNYYAVLKVKDLIEFLKENNLLTNLK